MTQVYSSSMPWISMSLSAFKKMTIPHRPLHGTLATAPTCNTTTLQQDPASQTPMTSPIEVNRHSDFTTCLQLPVRNVATPANKQGPHGPKVIKSPGIPCNTPVVGICLKASRFFLYGMLNREEGQVSPRESYCRQCERLVKATEFFRWYASFQRL